MKGSAMIDSDPTKLEKSTGSLPVGIASASVAILGTSITPLAAFVPFLVQSLATGRHAKRVDKALSEINEILKSHEDSINSLTDYQFKIINEVISTIFQTVDDKKISFLKAAINNTLTSDVVGENDVDYLSRIIRNISVDEINFIINNNSYDKIFFSDHEDIEDALIIKLGSPEEVIASGLINMGLIYSKESAWDVVKYEFSPIVEKVLVLLQK